MNRGAYDIRIIGNLIVVRNTGQWTLAQNIEYLSEFSRVMTSLKIKTYSVFVDMRTWSVEDSIKNTTVKKRLQIDRRNQKSEHWLCSDLEHSDHLLRFFEDQPFKLHRHTDSKKAWQLLRNELTDKKALPELMEWFNEEN